MKDGEIYNISSGIATSIGDISRHILRMTDKEDCMKLSSDNIEKQRGKSLIISCEKIIKEFDWKPMYDIEEGIKNTFKWYSENHDWAKQFKASYMADRDDDKFVIDCVNNPYRSGELTKVI